MAQKLRDSRSLRLGQRLAQSQALSISLALLNVNTWSWMPTSLQKTYFSAYQYCGTETLLEMHRGPLDVSNRSIIHTLDSMQRRGRISRLIIARLNRIYNNELNHNETLTSKHFQVEDVPATRETEIDYYEVRVKEGPFSDASNSDPLDYDRKEDSDHKIFNLLQHANQNGLPMENNEELRQLVTHNADISCTLFLSSSLAKITPLCIVLAKDVETVCVRVRN